MAGQRALVIGKLRPCCRSIRHDCPLIGPISRNYFGVFDMHLFALSVGNGAFDGCKSALIVNNKQPVPERDTT